MLCGAEPGAEAVITRLYVPGGVAPDGPCGTLAQPASEIANSASAASGETRRSFSLLIPVTATIIAKATSIASEGSQGPGTLFSGPKRGPNQEQKVFTVIIVAVVPGPRFTEGGAIEHVIVGCWLAQLRFTVPANPFTDERLNRKTAVSPGWTVTDVPPPGPGLKVKFTVLPEPVSGIVCVPFEASLRMVTAALNVFVEGGVNVTTMVHFPFGWIGGAPRHCRCAKLPGRCWSR